MMKYSLKDEVYFLESNKIHKGIVIARKFSDSIPDPEYACYIDGSYDWVNRIVGGRFTSVYIVYDTDRKQIDQYCENELFINDKELIDSLYVK